MAAPSDRPGASGPPASREDLSAVPAFLRRGSLVLPRPATPPPALEPAAHTEATARVLDPGQLPSPLSRRRVAMLAAGLVVVWLAFAFSRQVGDASAASGRAGDLRAGNALLREHIATLQEDLQVVQDGAFQDLQGRAYGLGARHEIPFALSANAPSLVPDAPGSASQRVGAAAAGSSPLEAWLELLFGAAP